jgi:hypothetical protein
MRAADYTVGSPRPECLNRRTSPGDDSLNGCCVALLNARQTASLVTAYAETNVYLVQAARPIGRPYQNRAAGSGAVTELAVWR